MSTSCVSERMSKRISQRMGKRVSERKRRVKFVIKITLDPVIDAAAIAGLQAAPNKSAFVRKVLRGQSIQSSPSASESESELDELTDALGAFVM